MSILNRLLTWLDPIPPKYRHLAPAFDREERVSVLTLTPRLLSFGMGLLAFFALSDYFFYRAALWKLLLLRMLLISNMGITSALMRRYAKPENIYSVAFTSSLISVLLVEVMLIFNHDPTGPYMLFLIVMMGYGAVMP